jgi:hypothetical protein
MLKSYRQDRAKVGSSQVRSGFDHMAAFVEFLVELWRNCASFRASTQILTVTHSTLVQASAFSVSTNNSAAQEMLRRLRKPKVRSHVNKRLAPRLTHSQQNPVHVIHINLLKPTGYVMHQQV